VLFRSGMRGNIFGALGSRLGTTIHAGTFGLSRRPDTVVGQNVLASMALTLAVSLALAVLAKAVAVGFGLEHTISIADFVVISVVGGALSSALVLAITLAVAAAAARREWDLDSVAAPLVTAAGDVVTLPALFVATLLVGIDVVTPVVAGATAALSLAALVGAVRAGLPLLRRVVRESLPILLVAGLVDVLAGVTVEKRLGSFLEFPALLVLVPPFLEAAGALGGILSSRLGTRLHLGLIAPVALPQRVARRQVALIAAYAGPIFAVNALLALGAAGVAGLASPGAGEMVAVAMLAGVVVTVFAVVVAYYGSIATYRFGLDPDSHGIPMVTSTVDFVGALSLILAIVILGVA
jgi:mgtE-like transporter